jgi:Phosphatidate cytidylyltransferase, mitochondrial
MTELDRNALSEELTERRYPSIEPFVEHFKGQHGEALVAIIMYGSCLAESTCTESSIPDFFLITDDYKAFHKKWSHRWANSTLPPAVFHMSLPDKPERSCKYNVVSVEDLEISIEKLKDLYLPGRFSKRMALLYSRTSDLQRWLAGLMFDTWRALTPYALIAGSTEFDVPDFAKNLLSLSYRGEVRLEKTDEKVAGLYEAEKAFYDAYLGAVLDEYAHRHRDDFRRDDDLQPGRYALRRTTATRAVQYKQMSKLLAKSRRRAKMRWPLAILTVDGWVDILLAKLERTYGTRIELKPYERRFILIFGWRHYFRLRKQGKVK